MVLFYIDYILCIHKDTLVAIDALESIYVMKQGSMVLGGKLIKPEILKNAGINLFLLEPFDVVYT